MDVRSVIEFPRPDASSAVFEDGAAAALVEIDAAIAMVAAGAARRVRLTALPFVESVAAVGLAHARQAGLAFRYEPPERAGVVTLTIGPRDATGSGVASRS